MALKHYKGFERYVPQDAHVFPDGKRSMYHKDAKGKDWYEIQKTFAEDTWKVVYDPKTGVVIMVDKDASRLLPDGNVVEVKELPEGYREGFGHLWVFDGKKFVPNTEHYEFLKQRKIASVAHVIAPLQDAVDLGMATEDEQAKLLAWKKYRIELSRTDVSAGEKAVLPTEPEV